MKETIKTSGKKSITFSKNGLHKSTNTPIGKPMPAAKEKAALEGISGDIKSSILGYLQVIADANQKINNEKHKKH